VHFDSASAIATWQLLLIQTAVDPLDGRSPIIAALPLQTASRKWGERAPILFQREEHRRAGPETTAGSVAVQRYATRSKTMR